MRQAEWKDKYGYRYEDTLYDPVDDAYLTDESYAALMKSNPGRSMVVFFPYRKEWLANWLTVPHMTLASDAMAGVGDDGELLPWDADWTDYRGHPRTSRTRGATFRMGREHGVPLMFTIAQASYWAAKHLGDTGLEAMKVRGRVQVGKIADLTLFNPKTVAARATYKNGENGLPTVGIPYVIVNGTIVVKEGEVLPVKPGQPIRFPVEAKGRVEPLAKNKWLGVHTINVPDMHEVDDTGAAHMIKK